MDDKRGERGMGWNVVIDSKRAPPTPLSAIENSYREGYTTSDGRYFYFNEGRRNPFSRDGICFLEFL